MNTVSRRQLLMTFGHSLAILGATAAACLFFDVSIPVMTRDAAALGHISPLWGIVSNIGILLWCAAASIGLFAAAAVRGAGSSEAFRFLLFSSLLTAYLLFDDFFQFHENLAVHYMGLDERVVEAVAGIAAVAYLIVFKRFILQRTRFVILLLALGFFAVSGFIDVVLEPWLLRWIGHWEYFLEDGAKLMGIACWCSYLAGTSHQLLAGARLLPERTLEQVDLSADGDPSR